MKHNCLTTQDRDSMGGVEQGRGGKGQGGAEREGKQRERKDAAFWGRANKASGSQSIRISADIDIAALTDTKHVSQ